MTKPYGLAPALRSGTKGPGEQSDTHAYNSKPGFLQHHNLVTTEQRRGQTASPAPQPLPTWRALLVV